MPREAMRRMGSVALFSFSHCCLVILLSLLNHPSQASSCGVKAIYQFGDSIADTGNFIRILPASEVEAARHPYGITIQNVTGRFSDGLLMIDFLAMALGFPFLNPYLHTNASFAQGANFAVVGATALNSSFFAARNIQMSGKNPSLDVQLQWFRDHLSSVCRTKSERERILQRALVMMGEIGGNDYNFPLLTVSGKTLNEVQTYVPKVVETIANAVKEVIKMGAVRVVVPGNFPIGCFPAYLAAFPSSNSSDYDDMGCLIRYNEFAKLHNRHLQNALSSLRIENPRVTIVYGDYYSAFLSVLRRAPYLGFDHKHLLTACCGIGGSYNYDHTRRCGLQGAGFNVCPNPTQYISWDGVHLTQEAYRYMSQFLMATILPQIGCAF